MPEEENQTGEGKFNIAIAYLLSINKILEDIKNISLRTFKRDGDADYLSKGDGQNLKLKLVRNLYVQASSLFKKQSEAKKIWDKIKKVKIKLKDSKENYITNKEHKNANWISDYNSDIEDELDEIIILIEQELQISKYFMPVKDESGLF